MADGNGFGDSSLPTDQGSGTPSLLDLARRFKADVLSRDADAADAIVGHFGDAWRSISAQLDALTRRLATARSEGTEITPDWLRQQGRLNRLLGDIEQTIASFADAAHQTTLDAQADAVRAAYDESTQLLRASFAEEAPPGVDPAGIPALSSLFGVTPADVVETAIGQLDPHGAVGQLFDSFGPQAAAAAKSALTTAVVAGQNPRKVAAAVSDALDVSLTRAQTIARTETLRAYRDATYDNYQANSDVVQGYVWVSDLGPDTCDVCLALNGQTFDFGEEPDPGHPNCRCTIVPNTVSWNDLLDASGLPPVEGEEEIADTSPAQQVESGEEWLARQPAATARAILGPAKFALWATNQFELRDLVGEYRDATWGRVRYEKSLGELGFSARHVRQAQDRLANLGAAEWLARRRAALGVPLAMPLGGGGPTAHEGFALKEPPTATATLTRDDLAGKTMVELRQLARDLDLTAARTKAETIDRILAKTPAGATAVAKVPAADAGKLTALRRRVDERMAEREALYAQQHDLVAEQDKLENQMRQPFWDRYLLGNAAHQARMDLYRETLDKADPAVRRYLKDFKAWQQAKTEQAAAKAEMDRLEREMDRLASLGQKGGYDYAQAKAGYDAAAQAEAAARKAETKVWQNLWTKSPGVYKPELDSIAGFDLRMQKLGLAFSDQQIAAHPFVVAAREQVAGMPGRVADVKAEIKALDKPIKQINKQIERDMARLKEVGATLSSGAEALDTTRPFSDVIALPEGHQPPNALMNKLDYRMHEPREVTKKRIINDIADRLKDNPAWQEYVARSKMPDRLGVYHDYIDWHASKTDSKSAALVADWIKKWGVGYKPGTPQWVAMQMAANEEFGLGAAIHTATEVLPKGEAYYAENGAALRALQRAMYDNTQAWFKEQGITELEVYRGYGWAEDSPLVPKGIRWGPLDRPNYGVADLELNPIQSWSADINVSQGTGTGNGFAGGGFVGGGGGGSDYSLLIGAKVPVDRILATAQTGFGAKLESEIVVMGRATDTVAYRAGTKAEAALLREADVQAVSARESLYTTADGTAVRVTAKADGTFAVKLESGSVEAGTVMRPLTPGSTMKAPTSIGGWKEGASRTYKSEKGVNNALKALRLTNTYEAPVVADAEALAVREGERAAAEGALGGERDRLAARRDRIPADVTTVPDIQDWLQERLPALERVDLMNLDAPTARLVANASANLIEALPKVSGNLWRISAEDTYTDALALVPRDGLSIILNPRKWTDLADLAERSARYAADGWWVGQTPEEILGHEIGHAVQIHYKISNDAWVAAMKRVVAAGGDPLVSTYAGDKIEESFAETFALVVYEEPTPVQRPIAREMAALLRQNGIDYAALRAAVGAPPLDLGTR